MKLRYGIRKAPVNPVREDCSGQTKEIDFSYDHNGLRTQKKVVENGVTTTYDYTLHGKLITHLTKRTVDAGGNQTMEEMHFFYDAQSKPAMVEYNDTMYRYVHNLQGDIVGILDANGNLVVEYKYDAWGRPLNTVSGIGALNPFRYRGYVWDQDVLMYHLESRFFDPSIGRFISSDSYLGDMMGNIYAYTNNLVVGAMDKNGKKTYATGTMYTGVVGFMGTSVAMGYCWDDQGNSSEFITYGGIEGTYDRYDVLTEKELADIHTNIMGGASIGIANFKQFYEAESIFDIDGESHSVGASIFGHILLDVGFDIMYDGSISDPKENKYLGMQYVYGISAGLDFVHISNQYTVLLNERKKPTGAGRKDLYIDKLGYDPQEWRYKRLEHMQR